MLRHRKNIPLDYSLCQDTVTVYRREGERCERRLWRMKRAERVAAVGKMRACFARRRICRAPQQENPTAVSPEKRFIFC